MTVTRISKASTRRPAVKERRPAMLFYGRDFYDDIHVQEMDYAEQGMYMRLCWLCWAEGSIPSDPERVARILKVDPDKFVGHSAALILGCFKGGAPGTLVHPKVEQIRAEVEAFSEKKSRAGKLGNEIRWGAQAAIAQREVCEPDASRKRVANVSPSSSSSSSSPNKKTNNTCATPDGIARVSDGQLFSLTGTESKKPDQRLEWFEEFWAAYRQIRSRAKKDGLKAFLQVVKSEAIFQVVMDAVMAQTPELLAREPEHRPYCASWLRGRRFEDEAAEAPQERQDNAMALIRKMHEERDNKQ